MRFNRQTGQKLTLCLINISFIIFWAVIGGCAQSLNPISRATNPDEGASAKKKPEPHADKTGPTKIGSNDAQPEAKASDSEADSKNEDREAASTSSSDRAVAAETDTANRLGALEEAIRQQNEKLSQLQRIIERQEQTIERQERTIGVLAGRTTANPLEAAGERGSCSGN